MSRSLNTVLLGPVSNDPTESVSAVNRAFVEGLGGRYRFVCPAAERKFGAPKQGMFNALNAWYCLRHLAAWVGCLLVDRPQLAHYAVSCGWGMEKAWLFLGLARCFGVKTLGHMHSGEFVSFWHSLPGWRKRLACRQFRKLNGIAVLSEGWRRRLQREIGFDAEKLLVVNNPINQQFEACALEMKIERAGSDVLALGIMERKKGVMDLLAATAKIGRCQPVSLHLVGPEREPGILDRVEKEISRLGLGDIVHLRSGVWSEEKAECFRQCGILVLPSYFENFPLVLLEGAAAGMALITTPVGAVPECFEDGVSALFVQPGEVGQLADALAGLLKDPARRQSLGRAARQTFQSRFSRAKIMASLDASYQAILSPGAKFESLSKEPAGYPFPASAPK